MAFPVGTFIADVVLKTPWAYRRNRYYFEVDPTITGLDVMENNADKIFEIYQPLYTPLMSDQCFFQRVECRFFGGGASDLESNSTMAAVEGDIASVDVVGSSDDAAADTLPDEVSLVIQIRTGAIGRSKRGRRFITGLSEQVQTKGEIAEGYKAEAKALADALSDVIPTSSDGNTAMNPRHYDRKNNVLVPITKAYALSAVGSRIDRRRPLVIGERI